MICNIKRSIAKIVFLIFLGSTFTYAQNQGTTSLQFLKIIPSAKIMAMGEAGVAIQNSAESVFLNPAGLAQVENIDMSISTVDWFLDTRINSVSVAYKAGNMGTFGIDIINANYGEFEESRVDMLGFVNGTYNPGLTGTKFNAGVTLFGLSYAKALTDRFSFGITANYIQEDLFLEKLETMMFNFGIAYDFKIKSLKLGLVLRNLGASVVYVKEKNTIPQLLVIGVSANLISSKDNLFMTAENHKVSLAVDVLKPRDDTQKYHVGLDYHFYNMVKFRTGYKINYDTESFAFGLGVNYNLFSIDYSYNDLGEFWSAAHRFTVGVTL